MTRGHALAVERHVNPYNTPAPHSPWWKATPAALGVLSSVGLLSGFSLPLGLLVMIAAKVAVWMLPPWRWFARLGATFGALLLLTIGAGLADSSTTAGRARRMPSP
ncbi:hypothetical protein ACIO3R_30520 [Streptomyces sp. NPDC087428]|uniref:hypothetical protein n=1 Tax=Streptomyces sp. NPDC087428 TaxID=3365788 RepID=UPI00381F9DBB